MVDLGSKLKKTITYIGQCIIVTVVTILSVSGREIKGRIRIIPLRSLKRRTVLQGLITKRIHIAHMEVVRSNVAGMV